MNMLALSVIFRIKLAEQNRIEEIDPDFWNAITKALRCADANEAPGA
jgi:hypothetical protein